MKTIVKTMRVRSNLHSIRIGSVTVDLKVINSTLNCPPNGKAKRRARCCRDFEVTVSKAEMQRIVNIFDHIGEFTERVWREGKFRNVFEKSGRNYNIVRDDKWGCVFLYDSVDGPRCSIQASCNKYNLEVLKYKPRVCSTWPLRVESRKRGSRYLTIEDNATDFCCVKMGNGKGTPLYIAMEKQLVWLFGEEFYQKLSGFKSREHS